MKIYTKAGDSGKTSLFSGERVDKFHPRLKAYGDLDELNSYIGLLHTGLDHVPNQQKVLITIQKRLFSFGSWIATIPTNDNDKRLPAISRSWSKDLENEIDSMQNDLKELHYFILPGGSKSAAYAHVARTICRRSERHIYEFCPFDDVNILYKENIHKGLIFVNRLSDYLFILARYVNKKENYHELVWS